MNMNPIEILLVEDNPGDVRLIEEVFKEGKIQNQLNVVCDGVEALDFLYQQGEFSNASQPDIILLDLNLPQKDGREVLKEIKTNENLKHIPVIVLTTSEAEQDIFKAYDYHANCYLTKPVNFEDFITILKSIENFWLSIVKLPRNEQLI